MRFNRIVPFVFFKYFLVFILTSILSFSANAQTKQDEILIGLIPELNVFKQMDRYRPLADYLSEKTGVKIKFTFISRCSSVGRFKEKNKELDGAFFDSYNGAVAIAQLGIAPLARPVNPDGSSTYHGYIFVRKDRDIKNAGDMKGKRMTFPINSPKYIDWPSIRCCDILEVANTFGYIFPLVYFRENGINDIEKYIEFSISGSSDAAIYNVLDGKADMGASKNNIYDRIRLKEPRVDRELVIIAESPKVPSNVLFIRNDIDHNTIEKIKKTLLSMANDERGQSVLEKFGAVKFIETTVSDFKPVFDLMKRAGLNAETIPIKTKGREIGKAPESRDEIERFLILDILTGGYPCQ